MTKEWFDNKRKGNYKMLEYSPREGGRWYATISLIEGCDHSMVHITCSGGSINEACVKLKRLYVKSLNEVEVVKLLEQKEQL